MLTHRYRLRIGEDGLTLTMEYPATSGTATRQEDRMEWAAVRAIELDDQLLCFALDGRRLCVPRTAFPDEGACDRFRRAAAAYRAAPAPADTRIQAAREGIRAGSF